MNRPQVVTHFIDGRPSETRDMTDEEMAELGSGPRDPLLEETNNETPSPT
jgi:hypothetical protein